MFLVFSTFFQRQLRLSSPLVHPATAPASSEQEKDMGAAPDDDEVPVVSTELYESDFDGFVKVRKHRSRSLPLLLGERVP